MILIEGKEWVEAVRMVGVASYYQHFLIFKYMQIHFHKFHELIEKHLKPSLLEGEIINSLLYYLLTFIKLIAYQAQMLLIEQQLLIFNRHAERLNVVKEKKAEKAASILGIQL